MPSIIKIPAYLINRLLEAQMEATGRGLWQDDKNIKLLFSISTITSLGFGIAVKPKKDANGENIPGTGGYKPFNKFSVSDFPLLFNNDKDYNSVVKWLKKSGLVNDEMKWIPNGKHFSWMLKCIHEQGYTGIFPSPKDRKLMAKKYFHRDINITDIKRTTLNYGSEIKRNTL